MTKGVQGRVSQLLQRMVDKDLKRRNKSLERKWNSRRYKSTDCYNNDNITNVLDLDLRVGVFLVKTEKGTLYDGSQRRDLPVVNTTKRTRRKEER